MGGIRWKNIMTTWLLYTLLTDHWLKLTQGAGHDNEEMEERRAKAQPQVEGNDRKAATVVVLMVQLRANDPTQLAVRRRQHVNQNELPSCAHNRSSMLNRICDCCLLLGIGMIETFLLLS